MKKVLVIVLIFLLFIPLKVKAISAASAIVMDQDSKRVLYAKNISEQRLIASTTKIMTCIVAIMYGNLEAKVIVDEDVLKAYGSAIYIEIGEEITLKDLLYGLMLRSGNDAAIMIAKTVAGDMEQFVYLMNETAMNIGMKNTIFYNAHGLEESDGQGNLSTAYDMALLTSYAMKDKTFKQIFGTKNYVVKTNYKTYSWTNKNKILHTTDYITGGKTGFTKKANRTLVTTASLDNKKLIVVTLDDPDDFSDHLTLYKTYFAKYEAVLVIDKENFKIKNENYYQNATFKVNSDYYALVTKAEKKALTTKYNLVKKTDYYNKDWIGTVDVYLKDKLLHQENIYILKKPTKEKENWWTKLKGWFSG